MPSHCGPVLETADVDGNGTLDLFIGADKSTEPRLMLQTPEGKFLDKPLEGEHTLRTDTDVLFFDANADNHIDLLIGSGGYHDYQAQDTVLKDQLYLNDGSGTYHMAPQALPYIVKSSSGLSAADFDQDGDMDVFIGGSAVPGRYPESYESHLLLNDGRGKFKTFAPLPPTLENAGLVTDSYWTDLNGDKFPDLLLIGEYMPIRVFINNKGQSFTDATDAYFDEPLSGLWSKIVASDFDKDGDLDFVVGNFGHNSQLQVSHEKPAILLYNDFDQNGSIDPVLAYYIGDKSYPFASRDDMVNQMIPLRRKFTSYQAYSEAQVEDILTPEQLTNARKVYLNELSTIYLENKGGSLVTHKLPIEAQFAPVAAIATGDFNGDGNDDLLLGGNQSYIRIRLGVIDANYGMVFLGDGKGGFTYLSQKESGLDVRGDVKSIKTITIQGIPHLFFGISNAKVEVYKLQKP